MSPWLRGGLAWGLVAVVETLHGTARALWLVPLAGEAASRQIGVLTGSVLVLLVALATVRWIGAGTRRQWLGIGALWVLLMLAFEIGLGRALGLPWERLAADYDLRQGGLMPLGLLVLGLAPWLAGRWHGITR